MFRKSILFLFAFFLVLSITGCAQLEPEQNMSVGELKEKIAKDSENLIILDVRTPQELVGPLGKIEGALNIPVQVLDKKVNELEKYKDKEIAVICRTGNRSIKGTQILLENGYDAKNVPGGMSEYRASEK